jgi:hypothetical protein
VVPDVDTVEVTNLNLDILGHSYVGDSRVVLTDIHTLITSNTPPSKRFCLEEIQADDGNDYWLVKV